MASQSKCNSRWLISIKINWKKNKRKYIVLSTQSLKKSNNHTEMSSVLKEKFGSLNTAQKGIKVRAIQIL